MAQLPQRLRKLAACGHGVSMAQLPQILRKLAALERWSWSFYGTTSSETHCIREVVMEFLWHNFLRDPLH